MTRSRALLWAAIVAAGVASRPGLARAQDAAPKDAAPPASAPLSAYQKAVPREVTWDTSKPKAPVEPKKPDQPKSPAPRETARPEPVAPVVKTEQAAAPAPIKAAPTSPASVPAKIYRSVVSAPHYATQPTAAVAPAKPVSAETPSHAAVPLATHPGLAKMGQASALISQAGIARTAQADPPRPTIPTPVQPVVPAVREPAQPIAILREAKPAQQQSLRTEPARPPLSGDLAKTDQTKVTPQREAAPPVVASVSPQPISTTPPPPPPPPPPSAPVESAKPPAAVPLPPKTDKAAVAPQLAVRALQPVTALATQHGNWGRLSFVLHGNPAPAVRRLPDGVELTFAAGTKLQIPAKARLRETSEIVTAEEDGTMVARIRMACNCMPDEQTVDGILRLDFHTKTAEAARTGDTAKSGDGKASATPSATEAVELATLRETLIARLSALNGTPVPAPRPPAAGSVPPPSSVVGVAVGGNSVQTGPDRLAGQSAASQASPAPPGPPAVCVPPVDTAGWLGPDGFARRQTALRAQVAFSRGGSADMAELAEFYLANGLGHEALSVAADALAAGPGPELRGRLNRDADIARLLKGEPLAPDTALPMATAANCPRSDAPLWRSLAAAAARDTETASRDAGTVATLLRQMPEPLLRALAFRIVSGMSNNVRALQAMAGALRNSTNEIPEDEARRFLLQARIAALSGDRQDYAAFLERAARFDMTPPGMIAKARLAAIRAGETSPLAERNEAILADVARTYRYEPLGQQAAEQYAELQLRRRDYAAALEIADESAGPRGAQSGESRGASLAVRVLRMLFVEPGTPAPPDPAERIALYLRYGGYTTPGEKGDDIRLAVARLMLERGMTSPALDVLKQLSDANASSREAMEMRAAAEAKGGDPSAARELARKLPEGSAARRIEAEAARRMNKPLEAAHLLDDATEFTDRARRANLLFEGEAWGDAASAFAELLHDPSVSKEIRDDLARRYSLSVAMSGATPSVTPPKLPERVTRLLAAVPSRPPARPGAAPDIKTLRGALERTRGIEDLLDPDAGKPGS